MVYNTDHTKLFCWFQNNLSFKVASNSAAASVSISHSAADICVMFNSSLQRIPQRTSRYSVLGCLR